MMIILQHNNKNRKKVEAIDHQLYNGIIYATVLQVEFISSSYIFCSFYICALSADAELLWWHYTCYLILCIRIITLNYCTYNLVHELNTHVEKEFACTLHNPSLLIPWLCFLVFESCLCVCLLHSDVHKISHDISRHEPEDIQEILFCDTYYPTATFGMLIQELKEHSQGKLWFVSMNIQVVEKKTWGKSCDISVQCAIFCLLNSYPLECQEMKEEDYVSSTQINHKAWQVILFCLVYD